VTASFRGDGSSRFGKESKWGYFPSISAGWSLSKEPFLKDAMPSTDIRLRASWGMSGNNNIGNYSSIAAIGTGTVPFGSTIYPTAYESSFVDAGLSWETTKQTNIGLDLGFWNGRLNVIANYYNSITTDVLYSLGIPSISGSTSTTTNLGDSRIRNRGFDIQLDARILEGPVTWTVGTNFSLNRNKVLYLAEGVDEIFNNTMRSSPTHTTKVGYPIGSFLGYRTNGIMSTADYKNVLKDRDV
jgi:outer membrane receptor protein involved in Fe transport